MPSSSVRIGGVGVPASKLRPPRVRHSEVTRQALMDHLGEWAPEILALQAPAGYGKSTTAIQWASQNERPVAWLTLDGADNDPALLMGGIAAAFAMTDATYRPPQALVVDEPAYSRSVLPEFLASITSMQQPVCMVVDDVHTIHRDGARELLRAMVEALPVGSQIAFAGRDLSALPLALWRGQGRVADVRAADLAFSAAESAEAVRTFRSSHDADDIHHAADGWPVAVYLLSQSGSRPHLADIEEFIEAEVLGTMPKDLQQFVCDTAPLGTVTIELATAVTGQVRAGHFLARAITTVLLQPSDSGWFVYHPLLQASVVTLLEREDPERLRAVRTLAARWHLANGHADTAVQLVLATQDPIAIGDILWEAARPALLQGRASTVRSWLDSVDHGMVASSPVLSLCAAWTSVATGQYAHAVRHGRRALQLMPPDWRSRPDTFSFAGHLALLQAVTWLAVDDVHAGLEAALLASRLVSSDDPASCLAQLILGVNRALVGDSAAEADMVRAIALARSFRVPSTQVEALAMLGLLRLAHGQPTAGCVAIETGAEVYAFHDLSEMATSAAVLSLARAALASLRGGSGAVRQALLQQRAVHTEVESILPWYGPLSASVLADVSVRLDDSPAHHEYVSMGERSPLGAMGLCRQWLSLARRHHAEASPLSVLTPAELRVWELLGSRMTLTEIADTLYLSRETVKSHTSSIYRKLGVATRREAQDLADNWQ